MVGHYYGNLYGGTYRDMNIYYDDIYISQSRARIEIGNQSSWNECTHREIQKVVSWPRSINEYSITINVNKGSLPSGYSYLYYIDFNGIPSLMGKIYLN